MTSFVTFNCVYVTQIYFTHVLYTSYKHTILPRVYNTHYKLLILLHACIVYSHVHKYCLVNQIVFMACCSRTAVVGGSATLIWLANSFIYASAHLKVYLNNIIICIPPTLFLPSSFSSSFHLQFFLFSSGVEIPPSQPGPVLQVTAIVNPLSQSAQKLAPLLSALSSLVSLNITIILNPLSKLSEMPLNEWVYYCILQIF